MSAFLKIACLHPLATWGLQAFSASEQMERSSKPAVWILSPMRAASSTILSMMSATDHDNTDGGKVFSLFEACHTGDEYSKGLNQLRPKKGGKDQGAAVCSALISKVARCDFSDIKNLWGWDNLHTSNGKQKYSEAQAMRMCKGSEFVAMKTVMKLMLENVSWVLDENPELKIVDVIRDPRGILASNRQSDGRADWGAENMILDCETFAHNMRFQHPRVHRIVFDDLVKEPLKTSQKMYKFLGRKWTEKEKAWVDANFNADCQSNSGSGANIDNRYQDCHSDSAAVARKWKDELPASVKSAFTKNEACMRVAAKYNLDM